MKRKAISTRNRFEIFKRDGFTCQYCGATPPEAVLHIDHIIAVANGGKNDMENLITACQRCNLGKSAVPLNVVPQSLSDSAEEAAERAAQVRAFAEQIRDAREEHERSCWEVAEILQPGAGEGWSRDKFNGVSNFIKRLGHGAVLDAAHVAEDRQLSQGARFKYFCGVCWNRVREAEE